MTSITRRQAITGVAAAATGAALATQASIEFAQADAAEEQAVDLADARYDVDVVILGAGAAGMAATMEAALQGVSAITLETGPAVGGTTAFSEGILGVNTPLQQKLDLSHTVQDLLDIIMPYSNYVADERIVRGFLEHADEDIAWLTENGAQINDEKIGGSAGTQHLYVGYGLAMCQALLETATSMGAQVLTSTRGIDLVMEDGRVAGIIAEDDEGTFAIRTKAVVIATGGFIQNPEMFKEVYRQDLSRYRVDAADFHFGDGIRMAYSAGADQSAAVTMNGMLFGLRNFGIHSHVSVAATNEPYFWVNQDGVRFMDESLFLRMLSVSNNILMNQAHGYSILTTTEIERLMTEGCTFGWGPYVPRGTTLDELQSDIDQAMADRPEGFFVGETIEELAESMGVPAENLRASVDAYNQMCADGVDTEFNKDPQYLRALPEEGPFYAFELLAGTFCTMGGLRVNTKNEVLDPAFAPIPGLYGAGCDCSGTEGTTYCPKLGGAVQGYAVYSGRNSIWSAAEYLAG